jgi:carboxypeptidase Taq
MTNVSYAALEKRFARLSALDDARGMLGWDQATMMPSGGATARSEQIAAIAAVCHGILTSSELEDCLAAAEVDTESLNPWQRANLDAMRRQWRHATAIDEDLVSALSRAASACEYAWRQARRAADFALVKDQLDTLLGLVRQKADSKGAALGLSPYDALLDSYEPGGRATDIEVVFADLATFLPSFMSAVIEQRKSRPAPLAIGDMVPAARQQALGERIMAQLGFNFHHGRLDVSEHPFSGGVPTDQRITTRYDESDPLTGFMAVLHETGHSLYEAGLPAEWRGQPVGVARSMSIHESQSLLMEMQVGCSRSFLTACTPMIAESLGVGGPAWKPENLYHLATRVAPGFIRVDADEVTYPAHVMLRFDLERAMIAGNLRVADLPGAWNEGMKRLLGIVPPSDQDGCLQDIHWYDGAFGYFPTYTLGAMTAAQLMAAARKTGPAIDLGISKGDLTPLLAWLQKNIHARASSLPIPDLVTAATGEPLHAKYFKDHLSARYLD